MKKIFFLLAWIPVCSGLFIGFARGDDFQLWTELKYQHAFKGTPFEIQWSTENRFRNDATDYFLFNTTTTFFYKPFSWLSSGFGYRFEMQEPAKGGEFRKENRLRPQFEVDLPLGPLHIKNRNMFEFRFFSDPYDFRFRYRSRFRIERPFKTSPVSFTPYVSEEFFVETGRGLNQNRIIAGNSFGFFKNHVSFDLYYLLRRDKETSGGWSTANVLGTSLGFKY